MIHGWILEGTYGPGDRLPRDEDLAVQIGCARSTVHRAMGVLAEKGIVDRKRRGGTSVRPRLTRATFEIPVMRSDIELSGAQYDYRLLSCNRGDATDEVMAHMSITDPQDLLHIQSLHYADGVPHFSEDRWVSLRVVPEIMDVDLSQISANEWLLKNRPFLRAELSFAAVPCPKEQAPLLNCAQGEAIMMSERLTWIDQGAITFLRAWTQPGYTLNTQV